MDLPADPHAGRFLDSSVPAPEGPSFTALGNAGSDSYVGLELFDNPGCHSVTYDSDELMAHCPVTGQPDFYKMSLILLATEKCIESKSLKLWLRQFASPSNGIFCEGLAAYIRDQVGMALGYERLENDLGDKHYVPDEDEISKHVQVTLTQKSRGGISIRAVA